MGVKKSILGMIEEQMKKKLENAWKVTRQDKKKKPLIGLIVVFVICMSVDSATKQWAFHVLTDDVFIQNQAQYHRCVDTEHEVRREHFLSQHRKTITAVDGFLDFRYEENCSGLFAFMYGMDENLRVTIHVALTMIPVFFLFFLYRVMPPNRKLVLYAMTFMSTGALVNFFDRCFVYGYVIDFISAYFVLAGEERRWATFNVADSLLVVGMVLFAIQMVVAQKEKK